MLSNYQDFENVIRSSFGDNSLDIHRPKIKSIAEGNFFIRYTAMQSWFLRCSYIQKLKFLRMMFDIIKKHDMMPVWYNIINANSYDKLMAYASTLKYHQMHYDKVLFDTNRTCDKNELDKTMADDIEWFKQFDGYFQEGLFLALLSMGGGGIIKNFCGYMNAFYTNPCIYHKRSLKEELKVFRFSKNCLATVLNERSYEEPLDPKNPVDLVVLNKRKEWAKMIAKYSVSVKGKILDGAHKKKHKGKKGKKGGKKGGKKESKKNKSAKKGKKSGKSSKKSKSSKSSKKGKKGKKGSVQIDYLQILPIGIVKKIFGYLDKKTLKKIAAVNPYWKYAVDSLKKDVKARKKLDKAITKHEKTVTPSTSENMRTCKREERKSTTVLDTKNSRRIQKALNDPHGLTHEESLITKAIEQMAENYYIPIDNKFKSFPRQLYPVNNRNIYTTLPCIIYEGGFMERHMSGMSPISSDINIYEKISKVEISSPRLSNDDFGEKLSAVFTPELQEKLKHA